MAKTEHVGLTALDAERSKLLKEYDTAVEQAGDDPVKTEHGVSCEAHFRTFLEQFLPKKYGVTKGYIITPDLNYAGPLEEWDIIIYDAMESPVLFVRRTKEEEERAGKRGIPVEYVRGVIEVKATFNKVMVEQAANKLLKLRQFQGKPGPPPWNRASILPDSFRAAAVFFETKVKNPKEYSDALTALAPLWQTDPLLAFIGALILRGQGHPEASAKISYFMCGTPELKSLLADCCEASDPFEPFVADACGYVVSGGFDKNEFWEFMIDLVHALNGDDNSEYTGPPKTLTGGYGIRRGGSRQALFPAAAKK